MLFFASEPRNFVLFTACLHFAIKKSAIDTENVAKVLTLARLKQINSFRTCEQRKEQVTSKVGIAERILWSRPVVFNFFVPRLITSGVTDRGQGCALPPWQAECKKWAPLRDFMNCGIWKCFYKFWKSVDLDILNIEILQCLANQQSSNES